MLEVFKVVLNNMLALFICMGMGYACRRLKLINDEIHAGLTNLLIKMIMPCLIVSSMQREFSSELLVESIVMLALGFLFHLTGTVIGGFLCRIIRIRPDERGVIIFVLTFPNVVYMGLPVISSIYGDGAVFYVAMGNVAFNVLVFTLGIHLITVGKSKSGGEKFQLKALLHNIPIWATIIGFMMFLMSIKLPVPIGTAFEMTGRMTVPISMLLVGATLAKANLKEVFLGKTVYFFTFVRLAVIPVMLFFALRPFLAGHVMLADTVLMAAMPAASMTAILAQHYDGNTLLASKYIFITTLFSLVSIPLISLLVHVA